MFTSIQNILPKTIQKIGIKTEIDAAQVCEKYRKLAPRIVHADALQHTFPKFFRRRSLVIGVEDTNWGHQVMTNREALLAAINECFKEKKVKQIKVQAVGEMNPGAHFLD